MKRFIKTTAVAGAIVLGAGAAAQAGEFDGFYLGLYGSGDFQTNPNTYGFGGNAGYMYEFTPGGYAGVEADVYRPNGGPTTYMGVARMGYDFGTNFMPYASVGAGADSNGTGKFLLGAGAEYAVGGGVGLRAGVDRYQDFNNGPADYVAKIGVNYRF
ncbi:outer membrane beta-barrel protein [uncultured Maritimibacter sp.]|jgi:opacity protein-like surface antigen|uniref:outer membrane protein n=1 Tax=uncultured Maritimibacter sp. TaxID=991866 RepID=UPI00260DD7CB|nr:outer membrane beta-barrel protein [uncultured Maritimibacter sp.]